MKKISNEEAVLILADEMEKYDRANPDVGMPPSFNYFVKQAMKKLGLTEKDVDMEKLL